MTVARDQLLAPFCARPGIHMGVANAGTAAGDEPDRCDPRSRQQET